MINYKKISGFFSKYINQISILLFLIVFFAINLYDMKYKFNKAMISGNKYYIVFSILTLLIFLIVLILCKKMKDFKEESIPKIFVISSILIGGGLLILSPLFTGSDEHNHYYRIYEISSGNLVTPTNKYVGGKLPESLKNTFIEGAGVNTSIKYRNVKDMLSIELDKNNRAQYGKDFTNQYNNTALYSPIQYLPQVIGFSIGKLLSLNPYIIGMLGRIFNLIFYAVLGYFALKYVPKSKLFYLLILISPNMLQCATTLSADAFTNSIFLLLIAIIFKKMHEKEKINIKEKILFFILSIVISMCKIVYVPIVFLLLLLGKDKFKKENKEKIIFVSVTILISAIASLVWMGYTDGVFAIAYDKSDIQKHFILSNIIEYAIIFVRTFTNNIIKYVECLFVGTTMYHSQLQIPAFISFIYVVIVILALFKDKLKKQLRVESKIFIGLISIIIMGLISTAIYVQCTAQFHAIANPTITGIQGRYFIPIVMLIPYLIPNIKNKMKIENKNLFLWGLTINAITYLYMFSHFSV